MAMQILRGSLLGVLAALTLLIFALTPATVADAPIAFTKSTLAGAGVTFNHPTSLAFGPDGRLYVAELKGRIRALTAVPCRKTYRLSAAGDQAGSVTLPQDVNNVESAKTAD